MDDFNLGICTSRVRDINLCVWSIPRSGGVAFSERLRKRGDSVIWTEGQFWVRGSGYVMRIPLLAWLIPSSLNGARLQETRPNVSAGPLTSPDNPCWRDRTGPGARSEARTTSSISEGSNSVANLPRNGREKF